MARSDEQHSHSPDEPVREGDVLGLGGAAVPKSPDDPHTEYDPESIHKRQRRASGEVEPTLHDDNLEHGAGATGIDMGGGGAGTDVE